MKQAAKKKVSSKRAIPKKRKQKIAIVMSLFNQDICQNLRDGALSVLKKEGYAAKDILVLEVAGAYEIPLVAQKLLTGRKKYDGVIALGCVIRGDTPHFDYVCDAVNQGCMLAQLNAGKPISFGVITVNNEKQAIERSQPNDFNKGREAAWALIDSLTTLSSIG